jgi:hypothetical protein
VLTPGCPTQWNMPKVVLLLGTLMEKWQRNQSPCSLVAMDPSCPHPL